MFKRLNSFFHSNTDPLKSLSTEETKQIETVSNNLDSLESSPDESNKFSHFKRIISLFHRTFSNLTPWQSQTERIKSIYHRFTNHLLNTSFLQLIFENEDVYRHLFKSLILMTHQNNDSVPLASKFLPFFCQLIKSSKNSPNNNLLNSSFDFLTLLFKNKEFFDEFLEIDGVTLIFTSFFLTDNKEPIDLILNLLFCVVPPDFYQEPSMTTISIIQDALKEEVESTEQRCTSKCSIFLVHYLCSHYCKCRTIFSQFRSDGGFLALNHFLKKRCSIKDSLDCYKLMTTKTNNDAVIIHSLFELFIDSTSENRTQILKFLLTINANDIHNAINITEWIIDINEMTDEQIELVARIMLNLDYHFYISFVLNQIENLNLRFEVMDIFLDLIHMLIATNKIPVDVLIEKKFLENFLMMKTDQTFVNFVTTHEAIPHIILAIFKSPNCEDYRFSIVSKLIQCSDVKLLNLLKQLCSCDFSLDILNLLLNHFEKNEIMELLIYEISNHQFSFNLFVQCNGFSVFNNILNNPKIDHSMVNSLVRIIGALTKFGPKPRIDEWINSLPIDSPFFTLVDDGLLSTIAVNDQLFLNVPSLLPYVDKFDFTSPICLFNAGKYGIPMFLKKQIPITEIPALDRIANRYAPPSIMTHLMSQMDKLDTFIDITVPQYPVFELVPSNHSTENTNQNQSTNNKLPVSLRFKAFNNQTITSIQFEFMIKNTNNSTTNLLTGNKLTLMSCPQLTITYNDSIVTFLTNKSELSVYAKKGEPNTLRITFALMDIELFLNQTKLDKLKYDQRHPTEIIFGDPIQTSNASYNTKSIYLYRNLIINDQVPYVYEYTPNVYAVGYLGFASYFSNMKETEKLFELLEKCTTLSEFNSTYLALLQIQKSRNLPQNEFWPRILLSIKRSEQFVTNNLLLFLHQLPSHVYDENEFTSFLRYVLLDYELYFLFKEKDLVSFLSLIESYIDDSTSGINQLLLIGKKGEMILDLIYIMRSGISNSLIKILLVLIKKMLFIIKSDDLIREFLYQALCVGDWTLQLPLELAEYPIQSLLNLPISESKLQIDFFRIFYEIISNEQSELFSFGELLEFSNMFEDVDRSLIFYRAISIYSKRNPKYLQNLSICQAIFAKNSHSRQVWHEAFSILQGKVETTDLFKTKKKSHGFTTHLFVGRPLFCNIILAMLNSLLNKCFYNVIENKIDNELSNLSRDVLECLISLSPTDYLHFSSNISQLLNLANFGFVPSSFLISLAENKRQEIEMKFENVSLTPKELESINDNTLIYKSSEIQTAFLPIEFNQYKEDINGVDFLSKLSYDSLLTFLSNVVISPDNQNTFVNLFSSICFGSYLMFFDYNKKFTYDFISQVMVLCTQIELKKINPLPIALKAAKMNVFEHCYLSFISLVLSFLKKQFDLQYIKEARELILLSFHYIKGYQERLDLDKLFNSFSSICFSNIMLDDSNFYHFLVFFDKQVLVNPKYQSSYDRIETEKKWNDYILTINPTIEIDTRSLYGSQIINNFKTNLINKTKFDLMTKIRRICNHYNRTIQQATAVNRYLRRYEDFFFKTILYEYYTNNSSQPINSYHMSMLTLPYSTPRVLMKSPFTIKSPPKGSKVNLDYFQYPAQRPISKISQVDFNGDLQVSTEWFMDQRPFEYSYVLTNSTLLEDFQRQFGRFNEIVQVYLYYFIHPIPCVLFFNNEKMCLLFMASNRDNKFGLVSKPHAPIALIPFNEMAYLMEWHNVSLFCGHFVLTFESSRFIKLETHRYVHQKRALSFFYMFDPNFILIFDSLIDYENIDKKVRQLTNLNQIVTPTSITDNKNVFSIYNPNLSEQSNWLNYFSNTTNVCIPMAKGFNNNNFLFNISFENCLRLWLERKISSFDYLLYLNYQGGRSFSDCAQYPVFPWIQSPNGDINRIMELPMGQQDAKRSLHYDETFRESTEPNKYFYGCHYSLPGAVFWFMMRTPPFCYFLWDMNEGWDDTQRVFYSMNEAFLSSSKTNQTDLKEPIPEIYSFPEMFLNLSKLDIEKNREDVILPEWSNNSPYKFTEGYRKCLESSEEINQWIDLIFGYKETGENALKAKNLFLPSAYHSSTADLLMIDINAFEDQVILFGQCPLQLFPKEHPARNLPTKHPIDVFIDKLNEKPIEIQLIPGRPNIKNISSQPNQFSPNSKSDKNIKVDFNIQSDLNCNSLVEKNSTCPSLHSLDTNESPRRQSTSISPKATRTRSKTAFVKPRISTSKYDRLFTSSHILYEKHFECSQTKIGKNGSLLLEKSISIPPTHDYYLAVEELNECISVRKTDNNDLMCAVISSEFGFISHITISDDGVFVAISYENGYIKIYFIYYELKIPKNIELVSKYLGETVCKMSTVLSTDFICASLFDSTIVMWNIANGYLHRSIDMNNQNVIDMFFDEFDGSLYILTNKEIVHFSINGIKLREIHGTSLGEFDFTCFALLPYDFTFDTRLLIVGNSLGHLMFLISNDKNTFTVVRNKEIFKSKMKNIFVHKKEMKVWCCDDRNHGMELALPEDEKMPNSPVQFSNYSFGSFSPKSSSPLSNLS